MRTRKIIKWTLISILSVILLIVAAGCILIFYVAPRIDIKPILKSAVEDNLEAESSMSSVEYTFFSSFPFFSLSIDDFAIYEKESKDTIIYIENTECAFNIQELLNNRIAFKDITLTKPYVNFTVDSTGKNIFQRLLKEEKKESTTDSTMVQPEVLNLSHMIIKEGRLSYANCISGKSISINDLNFNLQGQLNMKDTILDVKHGEFFIGDNSLDFNGHIDPNEIDIYFDHNLNNLNSIKDTYLWVYPNEDIVNTDIKGKFLGNCHIRGDLDSTLQGMAITGKMSAEDITVKSSKKKHFLKDGKFAIEYQYIIGEEDSSYIHLNYLQLEGQYISLQMEGKLTAVNKEPFINSSLNISGDLAKIAEQTSLLPKEMTLNGNIKSKFTVSSTFSDLKNKYRLPSNLKDFYNLDFDIVLPNINGNLHLGSFKVKNDTLELSADTLNVAVKGNNSHLESDFHKLELIQSGTRINIGDAYLDIDGKEMKANIKIGKADILTIENNNTNDSTFISTDITTLNLACKGTHIADCSIEGLNYRYGETTLYGGKFEGNLLKLSKNPDVVWDACTTIATNTKIKDRQMELFCKQLAGSFNYNNNELITDIKANADSINVTYGDNEIIVKESTITSEGNDCYRLKANSAATDKIVLGIDINISKLDALFNHKKQLIDLKVGHAKAGNTDIAADGTINIAGQSPVIAMNLKGNFLDLNEIMIASNRAALASGDPNAVPLDSIPEGQIPVMVGPDDQDITLNIDVNKMTLTSLLLSNSTCTIYMKGKTTLVDNLDASDSGYKLHMNTMVSYINPKLSINDIDLYFENIDISKLSEIIPSLGEATPLLTTLKGNVELNAIISTPLHQIYAINMLESKATAAIQARDLFITDNETLQTVAKELMFKDKEHIRIDSIAIAAEIQHGQVKLYPVISKIDRYKLAVAGTNDMITKQIDYHISVLKSPIPFKFGINIKGGGTGQKIKLAKTELKKLDPSNKPWIDPNFIELSTTLKKSMEDFRKSMK